MLQTFLFYRTSIPVRFPLPLQYSQLSDLYSMQHLSNRSFCTSHKDLSGLHINSSDLPEQLGCPVSECLFFQQMKHFCQKGLITGNVRLLAIMKNSLLSLKTCSLIPVFFKLCWGTLTLQGKDLVLQSAWACEWIERVEYFHDRIV